MEAILETEKLFIKPLSLEELLQVTSENAGGIPVDPGAVSQDVKTAIKKKIEKMKSIGKELHEFYTYWLIISKESNKGIGFIGFKGFDKDGCLEVGYSISPCQRKKRLMTEALEGIMSRFREYKNAKGITAKVKKTNAGSIKVLENCGFALTGSSAEEVFYVFRLR